jgi:hypothetical protein
VSSKTRGRETAADMVRSLGLVLLVVVPIWFFAQPPDRDEAELRVVDPAADISAFTADVPAAPVPGTLPAQWRPTSSAYEGQPTGLRIGYVTPGEQYAEYAASTGPREDFVDDITGDRAEQLDPVVVRGQTWEQYRDQDGSLSLVRSYGDATVVVGTLRATASLDELRVLLGSLTTR